MKSREITLRLKRYEAEEKNRKVVELELMIRDFEQMAGELDRQIAAEEDRTGVKDANHFAYSTFAKSAALRRLNLTTSVTDLKSKLALARDEYEDALAEVRKIEAGENRDIDRSRRKSQRNAASLG
jgi:flagellar protein FliJ